MALDEDQSYEINDDEDIVETMRLLHSWKNGELTDKEMIDGLHESMNTNFDDDIISES